MKTSAKPLIAGIDEAGRGPWAGPVVAACVILPPRFDTSLLRDSKVMTPGDRDIAFGYLIKRVDFGVGVIDSTVIDTMGIKCANFEAMQQALNSLSQKPTRVLIDGRDGYRFAGIECESIVRGDALVAAISAASIIAKVWRDRIMELYDETYPRYGFQYHKGYGTALHARNLHEYGPCPIHRFSFAPVRDFVSQF